MTTDPNPELPQPPRAPNRSAMRTKDGLDLRYEWMGPPNPAAVVVLSHPHPLHGGNMYAPLIDTIFRSLAAKNLAGLRYNFRGVAGSEGTFGYGDGEKLDLAAAIETSALLWPVTPIILAGWSFGADVCLTSVDPGVKAWCAVAPPLSSLSFDEFLAGSDTRSKLLIIGQNDQFNPPDLADRSTQNWPNSRIVGVGDSDHFLAGHEVEIAELVTAFAIEEAEASKA